MDSGWAIFLSAVVAGAFSVLVAVIQKFKRENAKDHDLVVNMLKLVYRKQSTTEDKIDRVADRLTDHIQNH